MQFSLDLALGELALNSLSQISSFLEYATALGSTAINPSNSRIFYISVFLFQAIALARSAPVRLLKLRRGLRSLDAAAVCSAICPFQAAACLCAGHQTAVPPSRPNSLFMA